LQRIVQLNVHTQVIAVELEFVARADASVFVDVDRQGGDLALKSQLDVFVLRGVGLVVNLESLRHVGVSGGKGMLFSIKRCISMHVNLNFSAGCLATQYAL
jgi:hypothetical protein